MTHTLAVASTAANVGPYRELAAESTSATVAPSMTSRPVPAASRADANKRTIATREAYARYRRDMPSVDSASVL